MPIRELLLTCAADEDEPAVLALAGVLGAAFDRHGISGLPLPGLGANDTRHLMTRWFPGADALLDLDWRLLVGAHRVEPRADEIEDLVPLLLDHAAGAPEVGEELRWVAHAVAQACLESNHLWQDLQLPSRRELTALFARWFPALAAKNQNDMKWKKFLYKQLCEREELLVCKAPSCQVCADRPLCFGAEV